MNFNEYLEQQLLALAEGCQLAQNEVLETLYRPLRNYAFIKIGDCDHAQDAVIEGFVAFFKKCRNSDFSDESQLYGYLCTCVMTAFYKIAKKRIAKKQTVNMPIEEVQCGSSTRIRVPNHGLDDTSTFEVAKTTCQPSLDGKYRNGKPKFQKRKTDEQDAQPDFPFRRIDRHTLELEGQIIESVAETFPHGVLRVQRSVHTRTCDMDSISEPIDRGSDAPDHVMQTSAKDRLRWALEKMSPKHREVLAGLYLEGLSQEGLAKRLGVSSRTIRNQKCAAIIALMRLIQQDE